MGKRSREKALRRQNAFSPDTLRSLIIPFASQQGLLGVCARGVLNRLELFDTLFTQVRKSSAELNIDIVLQYHGESPGDAQNPMVAASQSRVMEILNRERYDVVGVEGFFSDPLDVENITRTTVVFLTELGVPTNYQREQVATESIIPVHGGLQYAVANPTAVVIGSEDEYLNGLHRMVLNLPANLPSKDLGQKLKRLRDKVAIAKLAKKLYSLQGTRGVAVLGFKHCNSFLETLEEFGIRGRAISADL